MKQFFSGGFWSDFPQKKQIKIFGTKPTHKNLVNEWNHKAKVNVQNCALEECIQSYKTCKVFLLNADWIKQLIFMSII